MFLPPTFQSPPPPPHERLAFVAWLTTLGLTATSSVIPPLADQIEALGQAPVRTFVLNLLPTQPEFALAGALSRLAMHDLLAGLFAIQHVLRARRLMVVLDQHDRAARRLWKRSTREASRDRSATPARPPLDIVTLLNKYPQGHPTILMRSLFGKRLEPGALPSRAHRIIVDPVACWAIGLHLRTGQPFTERPVQLFLEHTHSAQLVMGRLGETIAVFCARLSLTVDPPHWPHQQVIVNGMLAGIEVDPETTPITASTESITLRRRIAPESPSACLACGWCVDVCPTGLTPVRLMELAQRLPDEPSAAAHPAPSRTHPDPAKTLRRRAVRESLHCIGCGLCSYVCPTRLPLAQETIRLRLRAY